LRARPCPLNDARARAGDHSIARGITRHGSISCDLYEKHAAIEDTIIFRAWKKTLTAKQLDAIGDQLEDIERKTLGKNGFEGAVEKVTAIEKRMSIDLAALTP
jgi:hypothetical protein